MTDSGSGSRGRCGRAACSRSSAAEQGNIAGVREVIEAVARDVAPELAGWSPWTFAGPQETERRLRRAGFTSIRCWLEERPTHPEDLDAFVRTSILPAHLARLPGERREASPPQSWRGVRLPLDYVRLNVSARLT